MKNPDLEKYLQISSTIQFIRFLFSIYCRILFKIYAPLTVIGKENIPSNTPMILCSNHNSHLDTAILGIIACKSYNFLGALAAKDYWFDNTIFHFIASCIVQLIPISRTNNLSNTDNKNITLNDTIAISQKFLNNNNKRLVIYPEGTRSKTGEIQRFKDGASFFSVNLNLPILPIYLKDIHKIWGKGKLFMRPHSFSAKIGKPIFPHQIKQHLSKKEQAKEITRLLSEEIRKLSYD